MSLTTCFSEICVSLISVTKQLVTAPGFSVYLLFECNIMDVTGTAYTVTAVRCYL